MVAYLVARLKQGGFADAYIAVSDYDSAGEPVQGLIVRFAAGKPDGRKPIVLLGHMDVVDALAEDWVLPPFSLTEQDGYFFGRGTSDNKYGITNLVQTFIRLKQEGWTPARDLYLVFSGDEETGMISTRAQADYVARVIDPAYVLNSDAGGITLAPDRTPLAMAVQAAGKDLRDLRADCYQPRRPFLAPAQRQRDLRAGGCAAADRRSPVPCSGKRVDPFVPRGAGADHARRTGRSDAQLCRRPYRRIGDRGAARQSRNGRYARHDLRRHDAQGRAC